MPRLYKTSKNFDRILIKLEKKDKQLYENVLNKMNEGISNRDVEHYKNLRYDLKEFKRVQISHFVLVFKIDHQKKMVSFEDYDHHDLIYGQ